MASKADEVVATDAQVQQCREAILRQLGASGIAKDFDSLADALDKLAMWDFVENQAKVQAQYIAFAARDNAIIHEMTNARVFVGDTE